LRATIYQNLKGLCGRTALCGQWQIASKRDLPEINYELGVSALPVPDIEVQTV
jgi:hypothetical protein